MDTCGDGAACQSPSSVVSPPSTSQTRSNSSARTQAEPPREAATFHGVPRPRGTLSLNHGPTVCPAATGRGTGKPPCRPHEVLPFLKPGRPRALWKERGHEPVPPRKPVVTLEVNAEGCTARYEHPAPNRPALLLVQAIGDRFRHDPLFPAFTRKAIPVSGATKKARAAAEASPQRGDRVADRGEQSRQAAFPGCGILLAHRILPAGIIGVVEFGRRASGA